jgi:hypothetical protein
VTLFDESSSGVDPVVTHETRPTAALQFLVNFGVCTGREATRLDIRKLSDRLLEIVPSVTILAEHRFEIGSQSRADLHEVRVELPHEALPADEPDVEALRAQLTDLIRDWAYESITGFAGAELTEAELLAREAVVEINAETA